MGVRPPHLDVSEHIILTGRRLARQDQLNRIPEDSTFQKLLSVEVRRLVRSNPDLHPLKVTRTIPRGLSPDDRHLLLAPGYDSLMPGSDDLQIYVTESTTNEDTLLVTALLFLRGISKLKIFHVIGDVNEADAEICTLTHVLGSIVPSMTSQDANNLQFWSRRVFVFSNQVSICLKANKRDFIAYHVSLLQNRLLENERGGISHFWSKPKRWGHWSYFRMTQAEMFCQAAAAGSGFETTDLDVKDQFGNQQRTVKKTIREMLDARAQSFLSEQGTGNAVLQLGIPFRSGSCWMLNPGSSRGESSLLHQFMSNHFRSQAYFLRFNISERRALCKHTVRHSHFRDHVLLSCGQFDTERE